MKKYDELKKDTYLYLLSKNDEVKKFISAILLISLCHDKCIDEDKVFVSNSFFKQCSNIISFTTNYEKMAVLNEKQIFSLVRNKLAHGDFVLNEEKDAIIIKHRINEEEVLTSIPLANIYEFAKAITNYYDYLDENIVRERIYYENGYKVNVYDKPTRNRRRGLSYNARYESLINAFVKRLFQAPVKEVYTYNHSLMDLKFVFEETNEKDHVITNPYANSLMLPLKNYLENKQSDYQNVIELLMDFYIIYFYPLENFLKGEDKNILSLKEKEMFDFSKLNLEEPKHILIQSNVGKVNNYKVQLDECYQKINLLMEKRNKLEYVLTKNNSLSIREKLNDLNKEIEEIIDLFCTSSVKLLYKYSSNRSVIEHLRCSIMHGNYSYDPSNDTFLFIDLWKDEEWYRVNFSFQEFKKLLNFENVNSVLEQFDNTTKSK